MRNRSLRDGEEFDLDEKGSNPTMIAVKPAMIMGYPTWGIRFGAPALDDSRIHEM